MQAQSLKGKWAHQDLNLEPADYEPAALTIELWARKDSVSRTIAGWSETRALHRRGPLHPG